MIISSLTRRSKSIITVLILGIVAFAAPVGAATYTYDNLGRLTSATTNSGASCTYTYDAGGNLLSSTSQTALTVLTTNPQNQASNVPVCQSVYMQFSVNIEQYTNFANISLLAGQTPVSINTSISNELLTIDPIDNLGVNTEYTVTVPAGACKNSFW